MNETISSFPFGAPPVPPVPEGTARVTFSGQRRDFRRLVMRGGALELVTVGFYRFWLATDMRRHLWSNTAVDGDARRIHRHREGTADRLPVRARDPRADLSGLLSHRPRGGARAGIRQSVPLGLFFFLFAQFAIYRARRYRLTRTVWRGVRFWMTGSGWSYAWRAGLWTLLVRPHARPRDCPGRRPRSNATRCATRHTATCKAASSAPAAPCSRRCGGSGC